MFVWIILLVLIVVLISATPAWPHSRRWGYSSTSIIALLSVVYLCVWMFGGFSSWGHHSWWGEHYMSSQQMRR